MSGLAICIWLLIVLVDTVGHMAFKRAAIADHHNELHRWKIMLSSFPLWLGITCFGVEFVSWLALLSMLPLSVGVLLAAFNIVTIMFAGRWLYRETLQPIQLLGMTFIFVGVTLASGQI
jgi:drug/metabolite transporter (DMT)-like permease